MEDKYKNRGFWGLDQVTLAKIQKEKNQQALKKAVYGPKNKYR